jgi:hypothetical protein
MKEVSLVLNKTSKLNNLHINNSLTIFKKMSFSPKPSTFNTTSIPLFIKITKLKIATKVVLSGENDTW